MNLIDTKKLASTLQQLYADKEKGFSNLYWGEFLKKFPKLNKALYLMNGIGNISLPISKKVYLPFVYDFGIVLILIHVLKDMANITKVAAVFVSNDGDSKAIDCRGSNLLNSSKITLDAVSTALVESTFHNSAISAVEHAVAHPLSSSDITLEFNQLAISTPGGHYNQQINQQKPGTVIINAKTFHILIQKLFIQELLGNFLFCYHSEDRKMAMKGEN